MIHVPLLDRLLGGGHTAGRRAYTVDDLIRSVQRDLEDLLNARHAFRVLVRREDASSGDVTVAPCADPDPDNQLTPERHDQFTLERFPHLADTVVAFGLPDFSRMDQARIRDEVKDAVRRFEPRLIDPDVTSVEDRGAAVLRPGVARLKLTARLRVSAAPIPVAFDIVQPHGERRYEVRTGR